METLEESLENISVFEALRVCLVVILGSVFRFYST